MANGFSADGQITQARRAGGTAVTWSDSIPLGMGPLGGWIKLFMGKTISAVQGSSQQASLEGLKRRVESAN
ncbi:MAG TPA: hypothetical protein VD793_08530 [Gemmatimonadales bacterium]|nr:hypothetical protein [Gemmatimonadales bacterium]